MSFIADCLNEFRALPQELQDQIGGADSLAIIKGLEDKYGIKLSLIVILIAIKKLSLDNLEEYLIKKFNLSAEDAYEVKFDLINDFFGNIVIAQGIVNDEAEDTININQILEEDLLNALQDDESYNKLDEAIMLNISLDASFQEEAQKILLNNKQKIGREVITDGKKNSPTINNWIKDLIKNIGSELFDDVKLIDYFNFNSNVKILNQKDKDLLRRVFKIYRRIYFFTDDFTEKPSSQMIDVLGDEVTIKKQEKQKIKEIKEAILKERKNVENKKEKPRSIKSDDILEDLEFYLTQYPEGSLEYKAINSEINKIKKNKKK